MTRATWIETVLTSAAISQLASSPNWRSSGGIPFNPSSIVIINTGGARNGNSLADLIQTSGANVLISRTGATSIISAGSSSLVFAQDITPFSTENIFIIALENDDEGESYTSAQLGTCVSVVNAIRVHLSIEFIQIVEASRAFGNKITNPRGWDHEAFMSSLIAVSPPAKDSEILGMFKGDTNWILNLRQDTFPDSNNNFSPQQPLLGQGLMLPGGLDLYVHGNWLLHNIFSMFFPLESIRKLEKFTKLKGSEDIVDLETLKGAPLPITQEQLVHIYPQLLDDTWTLMYNSIAHDFFETAPPQVHSAILSFFFERGLRNSTTKRLIRILNSQEWLEAAVYLSSLKGDRSFMIRRQAESALILSANMPLSSEVGTSNNGTQQDRELVLQRLDELGFDNQGLDANINTFLQITHSMEDPMPTSIIPGSLSHCHLLSTNCPNLVAANLQGTGFKYTGQGKVIKSVQELVTRLGKDYQRAVRRLELNRIAGDAAPLPPETFTCTSSVNEPYIIDISIPGSRGLNEVVSDINDTNYSRPNLKLLLSAITNSSDELNQNSLILNDGLLEAEGLCITEGGVQDKVRLLAPTTSKPYLKGLEFKVKTNTAVSASLMGDMERNTSSESIVAPQSETAKFDFYMEVINSRIDETVADPPSGVVELLGISGWLDGQKVPDIKNGYNDTIIQLWVENGQKRVKEYKGSTAPGAFAKFYNPKGDAHLEKDSRYQCKVGKHKGYTALNQAEEFTIWRDPNKNGVRGDDPFTESGWFGINIHAAGSGTKVGSWSAGCQVIWGGKTGTQWLDFIGRITDPNIHANPDVINYTLVHGSDITGPSTTPPPEIAMPPFDTTAEGRTTTLSGESSSTELIEEMTALWGEVHEILHVNPNPKMRAALTCLAYDIGIDNLSRSTLIERINLPDYLGASESFEHWNNYNNSECADIPVRRESQRLLFVDDGVPGYAANFNNEVNWLGPWTGQVSRCFTIGDVFHLDDTRRRDDSFNDNIKMKIMELAAALDEVRLRGWSFKSVSWYRDNSTHTRLGSPSGEVDHTEGRAASIILRSGEDISEFQNWLSQNWSGTTRNNGGRIFTLSIQ